MRNRLARATVPGQELVSRVSSILILDTVCFRGVTLFFATSIALRVTEL
ncbi:MAG: hypothetical protein OES09_01160 [Gammaproteobacteria bacterium]|nr:hypothetical protein [Gammaproteobacteria bacterium]